MMMAQSQYNQLLEFLVDQFAKIDSRFERIDERFERIDERFEGIDQNSETVNSRLERLENGQDHILGELRALRQESIVAAHRTQRIEHWVIKASKKINLPYHP